MNYNFHFYDQNLDYVFLILQTFNKTFNKNIQLIYILIQHLISVQHFSCNQAVLRSVMFMKQVMIN